jgi:hypothetical protein
MDYILQFDTEADAQNALPQLYDAVSGWDTSLTIPNVQVTDVNGNPAPGWFIRMGVATDLTPFDQTGWTCQPVFAS